jgi:hypothetical protein
MIFERTLRQRFTVSRAAQKHLGGTAPCVRLCEPA